MATSNSNPEAKQHPSIVSAEQLQIQSEIDSLSPSGRSLVFVGSRDELLAARVATEDMFPELGSKRRYAASSRHFKQFNERWAVTALPDGRFRVRRDAEWRDPDSMRKARAGRLHEVAAEQFLMGLPQTTGQRRAAVSPHAGGLAGWCAAVFNTEELLNAVEAGARALRTLADEDEEDSHADRLLEHILAHLDVLSSYLHEGYVGACEASRALIARRVGDS